MDHDQRQHEGDRYRVSAELATIRANLAAIAAKKKDKLAVQTNAIAETIKRHPYESMAVGLLAGTALVVLLRPATGGRSATRSIDVADLADRATSRVRAATAPIIPALERMAEAMANMTDNADDSAAVNPIERLAGYWRSLTGRS